MGQNRCQKTEVREEGWSQSEKSQDILSYLRCVCDDDDDDKTLRGSIVSKLCLFDLSDSDCAVGAGKNEKFWEILGQKPFIENNPLLKSPGPRPAEKVHVTQSEESIAHALRDN